jgi:uncharacterized protein (DUF779 family)
MVRRLARKHGPLAIFQSGGCCDGSLPPDPDPRRPRSVIMCA